MFSMKACVNCQNNTRKKIIVAAVAVTLLCAVLTGAMYDSQLKSVKVWVYDNFAGVNSVQSAETRKNTVEELLEEANIAVGENDVVTPELGSALENGGEVVIRRGRTFSLVCDGRVAEYRTTYKKVSDALAEIGAVVNPDDFVIPAMDEYIGEDGVVTIARISYGEDKQVMEIPYSEKVVRTEELYEGESAVRQEGVNGSKEITYRLTYQDGELISCQQVSETVVSEPVEKVTVVGTKKKQNAHPQGFNYKKKLTVTATAYDPYPAGGSGKGITANGMKAQYGVVAVDPKVIPLGTKLYIESTDDGASWSYGYCIAADTGGAIKGNKIDLCYNTVGECIQFGRRSANVYVLE